MSKSTKGASMQYKSTGHIFGRTLRSIAENTLMTPPPKKEPRKYGKPKTVFTDREVLHIRQKHEFLGAIGKDLAVEYNVTLNYMRRLLDYTLRSKLIPKKDEDYD